MRRWIEKNIWKELRSKIIITFFLLLIYRLATYITLPGVSFKDIRIHQSTRGIIAFPVINFSRPSIISLGIMPYISSSIFIQFISFAFPYLQKIEVSIGSRKIKYITRWLTIVVCLFQSPVYLIAMTSQFLPFFYMPKAYIIDISYYRTKVFFVLICMLFLTIGTLFCLWIGEKITEKGIYNGISLIIITGIIARFPEYIAMEVSNSLEVGNIGFILLFLEAIIWLIIIFFTLCIMQIVRKVPLQYVRYIHTNNDIFSISRGYIPLKVTASGVMPIIFAEASMLLTRSLFLSNEKFKKINFVFENVYGFWYKCILIILMIVFTFFYRYIALPINKIVSDLKRNEAYIPRVKPGKETIDLLSEIYYKITFTGAILLALIATFPTLIVKVGINRSLSFFYGGTSLFIIVGVVLDTLQHVHTYLHTYDYLIT